MSHLMARLGLTPRRVVRSTLEIKVRTLTHIAIHQNSTYLGSSTLSFPLRKILTEFISLTRRGHLGQQPASQLCAESRHSRSLALLRGRLLQREAAAGPNVWQ